MDALYSLDDAVLKSENRIRPVVVPDQLQGIFHQWYARCGTE